MLMRQCVYALHCLRTCGHACPGFMPKLIDTGIDALFETIRPKEQEMLTDLLVSLLRRNAYSLDDFITGMKMKTDTLEDLA